MTRRPSRRNQEAAREPRGCSVEPAAGPGAGAEDPGCPVCRDEGDVGEVLEPPGASGTVLVRTGDGLQEAAADLVEGLVPGHRVLLHLGFVLAVVEPGGAGVEPGAAVVEPGGGPRETAEERTAHDEEDEHGTEVP